MNSCRFSHDFVQNIQFGIIFSTLNIKIPLFRFTKLFFIHLPKFCFSGIIRIVEQPKHWLRYILRKKLRKKSREKDLF